MSFEMKGCTWGNHPEYDKGFKAGQQSKKAEIDALKERILKIVDSYATDSNSDDMGDEIKELLK